MKEYFQTPMGALQAHIAILRYGDEFRPSPGPKGKKSAVAKGLTWPKLEAAVRTAAC
jgi:hypothetical protein